LPPEEFFGDFFEFFLLLEPFLSLFLFLFFDFTTTTAAAPPVKTAAMAPTAGVTMGAAAGTASKQGQTM
jgi:hypothetical protein